MAGKVSLNFTNVLAFWLGTSGSKKLYYKLLFDVSTNKQLLLITTKKILGSNTFGKKYRTDNKTTNGFGISITEECLNRIGWEDEDEADLDFIEKIILKDESIQWIFSFAPIKTALDSPHGRMKVSAPQVSMRYIELEMSRLDMLLNSTVWQKYKRKVAKITRQSWDSYEDIINPNKLLRGCAYHLDHKYSIYQGFLDNIPPEIIGHPMNLEVILSGQNCSKNKKCSISESILRLRCKEFDEDNITLIVA